MSFRERQTDFPKRHCRKCEIASCYEYNQVMNLSVFFPILLQNDNE